MQVRRGWHEHGDVALDRHFAAHPEDRDADVVIFHFCDDRNGRMRARFVPRRLRQPARNRKGSVRPLLSMTVGETLANADNLDGGPRLAGHGLDAALVERFGRCAMRKTSKLGKHRA